jgi:hypothetical protein
LLAIVRDDEVKALTLKIPPSRPDLALESRQQSRREKVAVGT